MITTDVKTPEENMSKTSIATIANFFLPGAGYLVLGVKRALAVLWLAGVIALTFVEFGIRESEPNLYWTMFIAVFVMNTAFAIDAYQTGKSLETQSAVAHA